MANKVRGVKIQSHASSDGTLLDDLLHSNLKFQALVRKSAASARKPLKSKNG